MPKAGRRAFVGTSPKNGRPLRDHRFVDKQAQPLGKAGGTLLGQELHYRGQKFRVELVSHVCVRRVGCV